MARVFRQTYSKPLPVDAEVFTRKGKRYARFKDSKGKVTTAPLSQDGTKIVREASKWYIEYKDSDGCMKRVPGYSDKKATEQKAAESEREAEQVRSGYKPKEHEQLQRPLKDHLHEYKTYMLAKGSTEKQANQVYRRALRVIDGCGFRRWSDIQAAKVQSFLSDLRADKANGQGMSAQTSNGYLQAFKQFCRWMVVDGRARENPVAYLERQNVKTDRRHDRRSLTPDEIRRLLQVTANGPTRFGMTGYERNLLYRFAAETGLRANEIRNLTVGSFDFNALKVTVRAGYSKRRREDTLPLRAELVALLRDFFRGKVPTAKAFGGCCKRLTDKTSDMIQADLADAAIPYVDEAGRYADFHSLRHTTGSLLAASGVHPKVAQSIMRHSDINLTMSRYTHTLRGQEAEAIENLPDFSSPGQHQQKATGTYDVGSQMPTSEAPATSSATSGKSNSPNTLGKKHLESQHNGFLNRRSEVRILSGVFEYPLAEYCLRRPHAPRDQGSGFYPCSEADDRV